MEFGSHTPISMDSSLSQTPRHPACAHHELRLPAAHHDNNPTSTPMSNPLQRAQWLRAAILGANDGLLSTTSLMLGVGAAKENRRSVILSGIAGAVAGACSMAVGEFVSVSTQRDIHRATAAGSSHSSSEPTKPCPVTAVLIDIANPAGASRPMSPAMTGNQKSPPSAATPERKSPLILHLARSPAMKVIAEGR
ncbi:vacuolar iron transporter homolog 2-like [Diospyros lotus]|uniref:vacuolar iron transporter homolog 2-like n=1 Tax=Diospyros lotus TaxID=55363 RepID=UPI0022594809|nr:vacuolar iron transporter homolog 2-like [Diospyros lotus]